jgi:hypothetical protein
MDQEAFEKAWETIRGHADKIYVFEGDRKPIIFAHAPKHNENVDDLIFEVNEFCGDRLDVILVSEYDLVSVGEKNPENNNEGDVDLALEF